MDNQSQASKQSTVRFTNEDITQKWKEFKAKFGKRYSDTKEERFRKQLFVSKLQRVEEHNEKYNQGLVTFKLGINQFSDYTDEEKRKVVNNAEIPQWN